MFDWFQALVLCVIGFFLVFSIGYAAGRDAMREEAVKRNVAEYNAKTGQWQWTAKVAQELEAAK